MEGKRNYGMSTPFSMTEFAYNIFEQASINPDLIPAQELDPILEPIWAQGSLSTKYSLDLVFPSNEVILKELTGPDRPWVDLHHISYFLPELIKIEAGKFMLTMIGDRSYPINPLAMHIVYTEGNMVSITEMIPIDISKTSGIVENVFIREDFSSEEIQIYTKFFKELYNVFS
jgi:hypothetical protein